MADDNLIDIGAGVASGVSRLYDIYSQWRVNYASQTAGTTSEVKVSSDFASLIIKPPQGFSPPPNISQPQTVASKPFAPPTINTSLPSQVVATFLIKVLRSYRKMPYSTYWYAIAWNGSVFCAVGHGVAATSPDGVNWTGGILASGTAWRAIAWNGTVFCAVGAGGNVATSPDGVNWSVGLLPGTIATRYAIAWSGSVFCAVNFYYAGDDAATSPDGITWTLESTPIGWAKTIAWNGSVFCIVVDVYALTSPNGVNWSIRATSLSSGWDAMAWNGSVFCAVGHGVAATSPDGVSWTEVSVFAGCQAIAWNGSVFCAIGSDKVATSPDGINWSVGPTFLSSGWYAIAWNGSVFCAVGVGDKVGTSPDGVNWIVGPTTQNIFITQADINTINAQMRPGEPFFYLADSIYDPDRERAFSGITFLNGVGSGFSGLTPDSLINRAVYREGVLLGLITSNTATTITLADLTYTNAVPGNVIIASPQAVLEQYGITWLNGVGSGFSGLVPNSLIGKAVYRNGLLIGIITGNTDSTITISDLAYTNATPAMVAVMMPLSASYTGKTMLLAFGGCDNLTAAPASFASTSANDLLTAPPSSLDTRYGSMERLSPTEIAVLAVGQVARMGKQFDLRG